MKIAITKLVEKSEGVAELFRRHGHEAIIVPTMRAGKPSDTAPFEHLADLLKKGEIDILIFTSALGVMKLFDKVKPGDVRIISVGPKTAEKVKEYGLSGEVIAKFSSDNFADYLGDIKGKTIGIPRAQVPNRELTQSLTSKGAVVVEAPAYSLEPAGNILTDALHDVEAVIFTSAKSFEYSGFRTYDACKTIAIGEKTARVMKKHGIEPDIVGNGTLESCLLKL
ncbi:MAG: uroporphyrinogen-III synthase [Candidatus Methanoperedens sp.]|nr:uroporphyrinogen-III synthase [Candidatus Methanoperedens sp.]